MAILDRFPHSASLVHSFSTIRFVVYKCGVPSLPPDETTRDNEATRGGAVSVCEHLQHNTDFAQTRRVSDSNVASLAI